MGAADQSRVVAAIQADAGQAYAAVERGDAWVTGGARQHLSTSFSTRGVEVRAASKTKSASVDSPLNVASVGLTGVGCGGEIQPVSAVKPHANGNRVAFTRELSKGWESVELVEWYVNGPLGLEQGFDIASSPCDSGTLVLAMDVGEGVKPVARGANVELQRVDENGGTRSIRYGSLVVHDADDREVPARITIEGQRLALVVDTSEARFPIVVDPLISAHRVDLQSDAKDDNFGRAVDISGNTMIVGVPDDDDTAFGAGAVYVFENNSGWALTDKIRAPAPLSVNANFGSVVAISGNTIVASASVDDGAIQGTAHVFVKSGQTWAEQAVLNNGAGTADDRFGASIDIDANTVVVGAPTSSAFAISGGTAYVFTRSGSTWTRGPNNAVAYLGGAVGTQYTSMRYGTAVAISGDTIAVGGPDDDTVLQDAGSVSMFKRPTATTSPWTPYPLLAPSSLSMFAGFGSSLALDGERLVVGAPYDISGMGSAYVYEYSSGSGGWGFQTQLIPAGAGADEHNGVLVALSGSPTSGTVLVVGEPAFTYARLVHAFTGVGPNWAESSTPLTVTSAVEPQDYFADTHGIGFDGTHLAMGAIYNESVEIYDVAGTTFTESFTAYPSVGTYDDKFGQSVAIDGDTLVVGAYQEPTATSASGRAFVYTRDPGTNDWLPAQDLFQDENDQAGQGFGVSVAIGHGLLVVGAPYKNSFQGVAQIFLKSGGEGGGSWEPDEEVGPSGTAQDNFGSAIAIIDEQSFAVAATKQNVNGAVNVFHQGEGWFSFPEDVISPPDNPATFLSFGSSLAVSGTTMVVGAIYAQIPNSSPAKYAGAGYVFENGGQGWGHVATLYESAPIGGSSTSGDLLGFSSAIDGDTVMLGAPYAAGIGYVSVFTRTSSNPITWTQSDHLAPDSECQGFGMGIGLSGNNAVISGAGCYEIWSRATSTSPWVRQSSSSEPGAFSAALDGDTFVIGAPNALVDGSVTTTMGTAFVAQLRSDLGDPCTTDDACGSGICVDGVCCNAVCTGTCMTCAGSTPGTCSPVVSAVDVGTCEGTNACSATGVCLDALGQSCSDETACASGFCVDGVCCDTACGGTDSNDCQACAVASGASKDGTCTLLADTHVCRDSTAACDPSESCTGIDAACPSDANCSAGGAGGSSGFPNIWGINDSIGGSSPSSGAAGAAAAGGATQGRPAAATVGDVTKSDNGGCSIRPGSTGSVDTADSSDANDSHPSRNQRSLPVLAGLGLALVLVSRRRISSPAAR